MLKDVSERDFKRVYNIMESSFPSDEIRSYENQKALLKKKEYRICGEWIDDTLAGFIAVWEFEKFAYIEHFAVDEAFRNAGAGKAMLLELLETTKKVFVLEVEPPIEKEAKRRITFYERNGFYLNEYPYIQPPLEEGRESVELKIMSYPAKLSETEFNNIKRKIFKKLFGRVE